MMVAGTWFEYWGAIGESSSSSISSPPDKSLAGVTEERGSDGTLEEGKGSWKSVAEGLF